MSVAPDILLQPAPDVRPKAAATKAPAKAPEPAKNEASSFAEVYAKERQAKAVERKEATAKAREERAVEAKPDDTAKVETPTEQPIVADSGNVLPEEVAEDEEGVIDPLLLLAMNGQLPVDGAEPEVETPAQATSDLPLPTVTLGTSGAPPGMTDASHDPELDMLNSLPGVRLALEIGAQNQAAAAAQQSPGALAAEKASSPTEGFANALAAFAGEVAPEEGAGDEVPVADILAEGLETTPEVRDSQSDARADAFASKLSALSQAINQQSNAAQRLPMVPGQPVAMHQGGWSEAVVDRVMWLSSQNLKSAEIQLDPAELGRMEVRIELNKDQAAQVTFISANPNVRDQLEGQMQRLRDMFSQQGMGQPDVNVADQSQARNWQGGGDEGRRHSGSGRGGDAGDDEILTGMSEIRSSNSAAPRGLVDYYA